MYDVLVIYRIRGFGEIYNIRAVFNRNLRLANVSKNLEFVVFFHPILPYCLISHEYRVQVYYVILVVE